MPTTARGRLVSVLAVLACLIAFFVATSAPDGTHPTVKPAATATAAAAAAPTIAQPQSATVPDRPAGEPGTLLAAALAHAAIAKHQLSDTGVQLIASFEGYIPYAYNDPVGYCTYGYGHLIAYRRCNATDVANYRGRSQTYALQLLRADAASAENAVNAIGGVHLTQGQFDALVSLAYNAGPGSVAGGIRTELRAGHPGAVPAVMRRYVYAAGRVLPGLQRRREAEIRLYNTPDKPAQPAWKPTATDKTTCRKLNYWRTHGRKGGHARELAVRRRDALAKRHVKCTSQGPAQA